MDITYIHESKLYEYSEKILKKTNKGQWSRQNFIAILCMYEYTYDVILFTKNYFCRAMKNEFYKPYYRLLLKSISINLISIKLLILSNT